MTYVEQLLGEQGQANRRLGEEILQQARLGAMHTAANEPRPRRNTRVATHHRMNRQGALGWSLAGMMLVYVLVSAAIGAPSL